jgi:hypothetical protein
MRQISKIILILLLLSFKSYCQEKKTDEKNQGTQNSQNIQKEKDEYSPEKNFEVNPKILSLLDDKVVDFIYLSDYCYSEKKGEVYRICSPKEGVFFYGEKGRYGVFLAKSIK